jgi:large subunit ribosomal protein L13e
MPKANNAIPKHTTNPKHRFPNSAHKGLIKVGLGAPKAAQSRRLRRIKKAKASFPRPIKNLRPAVQCETVRYNRRQRLGRGFSAEEIKAAGITPRYASTIGIAVDIRRKNSSEEGLARNTQRLKTYLAKLVLFPRGKVTRKGEASAADIKLVNKQVRIGSVVATPAGVKAAAPAARKVAKSEQEKSAYKFLKKNMSAVRYMGARLVRAAAKEAKAKAEAEKNAKK